MMKERLADVKKIIGLSCDRSEREYDSVTMIAVSKTKPACMIRQLYNEGVRDFGENKVQELMEKYEELPKDIRWHMIGHLQTNKVKYIVGKVAMIHSVDSERLVDVIEKESAKIDTVTDILVEVNISGEQSKFGVCPDDLLPLVRKIAVLPHIRLCGLMTVPPNLEDMEENRYVFAKLRQLSVDIAAENIDNVNVANLSMGMSNDYEIAIEEGATHVRIGTALFGDRIYK